MVRKPHPCYLCGKPCFCKGCSDCLRKGRASGLNRLNSRRNRVKKENDVSFVVSKDI